MYNSQELTKRIKGVAKEKNILIRDMLLDCELSINTVSQISDKKGLSSFSLARIADYLDVSVDYLLGRTDIKKEKPLSYQELSDDEKIEANRLLSLTDEEMKQLWNYVDFLLSQRDK